MARKKKQEVVPEGDMDDFINFLKKDDQSVEECDFFIPTGSTLLDYVITNSRNGGLPGGRVSEISRARRFWQNSIGFSYCCEYPKAWWNCNIY